MFRPFECFVGLRYVWSRRRRGFVTFMSAASVGGIALGTAALIVVLSIMNGLETETRSRLLSLTAHATLTGGAADTDWDALAARLRGIDGITDASAYVTIEGMVSGGGRLFPAQLRGVDAGGVGAGLDMEQVMRAGSVRALTDQPQAVLIGNTLSQVLGVGVGDELNLLYARTLTGTPRPGLVAVQVGGIFAAGIAEHDSSLVLAGFDLVAGLAGRDTAARGVGIRTADPLAMRRYRPAIEAIGTAAGVNYSDWTVDHRAYFRAVRIEKTMMSIILLLIVGLAAFNIVASLMMVVTEKTRDMAILRTAGLDAPRVARIFLVQGSAVGAAGMLGGVLLGCLLALNVSSIVPWLEAVFNFRIMPGDVYYVTELPSELHPRDVIAIALTAFGIAVAGSVFPARRAGRIMPADALRYD